MNLVWTITELIYSSIIHSLSVRSNGQGISLLSFLRAIIRRFCWSRNTCRHSPRSLEYLIIVRCSVFVSWFKDNILKHAFDTHPGLFFITKFIARTASALLSGKVLCSVGMHWWMRWFHSGWRSNPPYLTHLKAFGGNLQGATGTTGLLALKLCIRTIQLLPVTRNSMSLSTRGEMTLLPFSFK